MVWRMSRSTGSLIVDLVFGYSVNTDSGDVEVQLVRVTVADLGFSDSALTREILGSDRDRDVFGHSAPFSGGRAVQLGLALCPPAVGPQLRLDYKEQPRGERLYIGMKPIRTDDGEPRIFVLAKADERLSLEAARARPEDRWAAEDTFVFSRGEESNRGDDSWKERAERLQTLWTGRISAT